MYIIEAGDLSQMGKHGPKPKPGGREKNGRLQRSTVDKGTPELRAQRVAAHGLDYVGVDYPLDAMAELGQLVSPKQVHDASERVRQSRVLRDAGATMYRLFRKLYAVGEPKAVNLNRVSGADSQEPSSQDARDERQYGLMMEALRLAGGRVKRVTKEVAIYGRKLRGATLMPDRYTADLAALRIGLVAIHDAAEGRPRSRAA